MIPVGLGAVVAAVARAIAVAAAGAEASPQKQNHLGARNPVRGLGLVLVLDQNPRAHQQDLLQDPDPPHPLAQSLLLLPVKVQKARARVRVQAEAEAGAGARVYQGDGVAEKWFACPNNSTLNSHIFNISRDKKRYGEPSSILAYLYLLDKFAQLCCTPMCIVD